MVLTANHVCDSHRGVVDDHGEVVRGKSVASHHDQIVEIAVLNRYRSEHHVVPAGRSALRNFETQYPAETATLPIRPLLVREKTAGTGIAKWSVLTVGGPTQLGELIGRAVTAVDMSRLFESFGVGAVGIEAPHLKVRFKRAANFRPLVPVEPKPAEAVENALQVLRPGPLAVGVFDAQDELAAVVSREQPVDQSGPAPTTMKRTGRTRCDPDSYSRSVGSHRAVILLQRSAVSVRRAVSIIEAPVSRGMATRRRGAGGGSHSR